MSHSGKPSRTVIVAGDVTIDWNLAHVSGTIDDGTHWNADSLTRACCQRGGAALLSDLLGAVTSELRSAKLVEARFSAENLPGDAPSPKDDRFNHCYSMWIPTASGEKTPAGKPKLVWRVSKFLGIDPRKVPLEPTDDPQVQRQRAEADVVVLDDLALGFRNVPRLWPLGNPPGDRSPWIILKMMRPIAEGPLWDHVIRNCPERTILILTADDLRRSEVQISRNISWERTAQDLFWELTQNPRINGAGRCAHVIVSFHGAGAFLLSRVAGPKQDNKKPVAGWRAQLFFDPEASEGDWPGDQPGKTMGNTVTLTASIVRHVLLNPPQPDLPAAIQAGVAGIRQLFREGFGTFVPNSSEVDVKFPLASIAAGLAAARTPLAVAEIQDPVQTLSTGPTAAARAGSPGSWTILEDQYHGSLETVGEQIVARGLKSAMRTVPLGRFGHLQTVDRGEIEALRSIQGLIAEYCEQAAQRRPLSIAVFGPPGSGKSFGVEQVAKSVRGGQIAVKTFNLSQFSEPSDLLGALHQVRDIALNGNLPLVFWDEFDSALDGAPLGWLRYFLAPMQDGSFQEGQVTHPIGRYIFVFAGGTSHQMAKFGEKLSAADFQAVKGPDFVSRLKGFLNVLGPNRQTDDKQGDPFFVVRRAILLRSIFERNTPQLFREVDGARQLNIDPGVLRTLLRARVPSRSAFDRVTHQHERLAGRTTFDRSSLPPEAQLDLHVHGLEFLSLMQEIELRGELLETLARAAHEVYCAGKERDGWKFGPEKSAALKTHPLLRPYSELPEASKESNRATVRNIPKKLAKAGYLMIPSRSNEPAWEFPGPDLEVLAEYEHELWMQDQRSRVDANGSDQSVQHEYLVPWEKVPDSIKQIDRDLVRGIPAILAPPDMPWRRRGDRR